MLSRAELEALARQTANAHQLDPVLVCAVVEQETGWNTYAIRFEDGFYMRYVKPLALPSLTEAMARSFSWGLMQVMGQLAREFDWKGELTKLTDPYVGLDVGCRVLKMKLGSHPSSMEAGLLAWNGGQNKGYASEVLARRGGYLPEDGAHVL
jgi:soluble lytic murein transglycosylase-like protein